MLFTVKVFNLLSFDDAYCIQNWHIYIISGITVLTQIKVVYYIRLGPIILRTTFLIVVSPKLYSIEFNWIGSHDNTFVGL